MDRAQAGSVPTTPTLWRGSGVATQGQEEGPSFLITPIPTATTSPPAARASNIRLLAVPDLKLSGGLTPTPLCPFSKHATESNQAAFKALRAVVPSPPADPSEAAPTRIKF